MDQGQPQNSEFLEQCRQKAALHFGIETLRSSQIDVLKLLPSNSHVLATLPTGAGKTLIYTLPALVMSQKPVIVISPLIALMRDQVRRMDEANIPSVLLTSEQDENERRESYNKIFSPETRLIFVSPERLALYSFRQLLKRVSPQMVVVDEAHCIATWGVGFRPEYGQLGLFLQEIQPERVLALTATAANATRRIIRQVLFGSETGGTEYVSKPLRPHIFLESRRCFSEKEKFEELTHLLEQQGTGKSIVYFPTRKQCEDNARVLRQKGFRAMVYHAGLNRNQRTSVEQYVHKSQSEKIIGVPTF